MEITYETIIKYLVPKNKNQLGSDTSFDNQVNNKPQFITQKNIISYSKDFPEKFKNLFTENFYRYGITVYDNENNNISFWSSLLTLLDDKYILTFDNDELTIINNIKNQLLEISKNINSCKTDCKTDFDELLKGIDIKEHFKLEANKYVLQFIVDCLDINFIILDFNTMEIQTLYKNNSMNPWKQSLIFAKSENYWEPIMYNKMKENKRFFDNNNIIFKKILNYDNIKYYESIKEFSIQNNILDIIMVEKSNLIKLNKTSENSVVFISDTKLQSNNLLSLSLKERLSILNKMKVKELYELTQELELNMKKKSLKADLINSIMVKLG
jgi:hypothetical protein